MARSIIGHIYGTITSSHEKPSDAFAEYFKEQLNLQRDCGEKSGCIADTYYKLI